MRVVSSVLLFVLSSAAAWPTVMNSSLAVVPDLISHQYYHLARHPTRPPFVPLSSIAIASLRFILIAQSSDMQRARTKVPRDQFRGHTAPAAAAALNRHLLNVPHLQTRVCSSFSVSELRALLERLHPLADDQLLAVYTTSKDPRQRNSRSLDTLRSEWATIDSHVTTNTAELGPIHRDGLCHEVRCALPLGAQDHTPTQYPNRSRPISTLTPPPSLTPSLIQALSRGCDVVHPPSHYTRPVLTRPRSALHPAAASLPSPFQTETLPTWVAKCTQRGRTNCSRNSDPNRDSVPGWPSTLTFTPPHLHPNPKLAFTPHLHPSPSP